MSRLTNTNKDKLEDKIAKLDALIESTVHEEERDSAILARDRLLKKLQKHNKHEKSKKKKRQNKSTVGASQDKAEEEVDETTEPLDSFFCNEENCIRDQEDTKDVSFHQKRFILNLIKNAKLSCPHGFIHYFLEDVGFDQASRIIDNLIEITGDPRERPATDRQVGFLRNNLSFEISEQLLGIMKVTEASKIISAIKLVQTLQKTLDSPDMKELENSLK
jgi:hypothetical protein